MSGLQGRRVLVTATRDAATGLVDALHAAGAEVVVVPMVTTVPVASPHDVRAAVAALEAANGARWIVFSSAVAVRLVAGALGEPPSGLMVGAVGAATSRSLRADGWTVHAEPAGADGAAALAAVLERRDIAGSTVLLPQSESAHDNLAHRLEQAGADVRRLALYRVQMPAGAPRRLAAVLDRPLHGVTIASGSAARNLVTALGGRRLDSTALVVCTGAQTAADARAAGLAVHAVAARSEPAAMVEALAGLMPPPQPVP
ncbi:MAG: uroporphyrinogen-III synthase [Candidatus Dormibacteraeota bacterium]|nr:uroporphyrinogen-III synthase [Candidatus Dormibacteraeota bacterium]